MIETMVEKHLSKLVQIYIIYSIEARNYHDLMTRTCLVADPADLKPRSSLSIALGCIPHLIILVFAVIVVWTAKPSSSKSHTILLIISLHIHDKFVQLRTPLCMNECELATFSLQVSSPGIQH